MLARSLLLLLSFVLFSSSELTEQLSKCTSSSDVDASVNCSASAKHLEGRLSYYRDKHLTEKTFKNLTELCEKTTTCLGGLKCKEGVEVKNVFSDLCDALLMKRHDITNCLVHIYKAVSSGEECTKKHDFLAKDVAKKADAFKSGHSCILQIANRTRGGCTDSSQTLLNNSTSYAIFVKMLTTPARNTQCKGFYHHAHAVKCNVFMGQLDWDLQEAKADATKREAVRKQCETTIECLVDSCASNPSRLPLYKRKCDDFNKSL